MTFIDPSTGQTLYTTEELNTAWKEAGGTTIYPSGAAYEKLKAIETSYRGQTDAQIAWANEQARLSTLSAEQKQAESLKAEINSLYSAPNLHSDETRWAHYVDLVNQYSKLTGQDQSYYITNAMQGSGITNAELTRMATGGSATSKEKEAVESFGSTGASEIMAGSKLVGTKSGEYGLIKPTTSEVGSTSWWESQISAREQAAKINTLATPISKSTPGYYELYAPTTVIGSREWYQQIEEAKQFNPGSKLAQTEIATFTPGYVTNKSEIPTPTNIAGREIIPGMYLTGDVFGVIDNRPIESREIVPGMNLTGIATIDYKDPDVVQTAREYAAEKLSIPYIEPFLSNTYKTSKKQGEEKTLTPESTMFTTPLMAFSEPIGKGISGLSDLGYSITGSLPTKELSGYGNVGVGFFSALAQTVPFTLSVPYAIEWAARNPFAVPSKTTEILSGTAKSIFEREMISPGSSAGTALGMWAGGKVVGAGLETASPYIPITLGKTSIPTGKLIGESPVTNTYYMAMAKLPWENWAASGRPLATLAFGEDFGRFGEVSVGSKGLQSMVGRTTVSMPNLLETTAAPSMTPALGVYTRNLMIAGRETNPTFADLYTTYQTVQETITNPIQKAMFYTPKQTELFGDLPTASASRATMAEIFKASQGEGVIFTGSRANVRPFSAPFARGAEGFGGTMADFDILMAESKIPKMGEKFAEIVARENPNVIRTPKISEGGELQYSISTGKGKFLNIESFEEFANVPHFKYNTIEIETIGGAKVRVPGPTYALSSKLSGATGTGVITYSPTEGLKYFVERIREKDWPDFTSVARGISRDLYEPLRYDVGNYFQSAKTSRALAAEQLSDLSRQFAIENFPETRAMYGELGKDILIGVSREPKPLVSISPQTIAIGGATAAGHLFGILPVEATFILTGITLKNIVRSGSYGEIETPAEIYKQMGRSELDLVGREPISSYPSSIRGGESPYPIPGKTIGLFFIAPGRALEGETYSYSRGKLSPTSSYPIIGKYPTNNYPTDYYLPLEYPYGNYVTGNYPYTSYLTTNYPTENYLTINYPASNYPKVTTGTYSTGNYPAIAYLGTDYGLSLQFNRFKQPIIEKFIPIPEDYKFQKYLQRKKPRPARFMEIFSFDTAIGYRIPKRFGKAGPESVFNADIRRSNRRLETVVPLEDIAGQMALPKKSNFKLPAKRVQWL